MAEAQMNYDLFNPYLIYSAYNWNNRSRLETQHFSVMESHHHLPDGWLKVVESSGKYLTRTTCILF